MPYVHHRWLGGLLTNFQTISLRIKRLHDLERYEAEGQLALLPTRERMAAQADLAKLQANLGGVKNMQRPPDAMFVVDLKTEVIAVQEAQRLRIPIIGLVDTNCDPDGIDYVIPGNDDAIRSCAVIAQAIGDVVAEGYRRSGPRRSAPARRPRSRPARRPRSAPPARRRSASARRPRRPPRARPSATRRRPPRGRRRADRGRRAGRRARSGGRGRAQRPRRRPRPGPGAPEAAPARRRARARHHRQGRR